MIPTAKQVKKLYNSGLSQRQIAEKYDCSRSPIERIMRQNNIRRRSDAESISALNKTKTVQFTPQQKQLIFGSLLGDACLFNQKYKSNKTGNPISTYRLIFSHSRKQLKYLQYKRSILPGCKIGKRKSKLGSIIHWYAFCHTPSLIPIAQICRRQNRKRVNKKWLDNIDWLGIAFWYMDDGALIINKNRPNLNFYTNSFDHQERRLLSDMLERFGLDTREAKTPNPNPNERILVSRYKSQAIKFMSKISKYIIPSMRYKIRYLYL